MTTISATPETIAAILASAQGGETISLKGDFERVVVSKRYARTVTINAGRSTVRGLVITGANVRWRSGRIEAPAGAFGFAGDGYGVRINGAHNVTMDSVLITAAKKAVVVDLSSDVIVRDSRFRDYGEDGIIVSRTTGLKIQRNSFSDVIGKPTECNVGGVITYGLAKRDCAGAWTDGFHADAVQMRNGVKDALIEGNAIRGDTQGITQMDTKGDAPLERVVIRRNSILTTGYHPITLDVCLGCRIEGNDVHRAAGSAKRAVIIAGKAVRCGNIAPDDRIKDGPCG